MKKKVTTKKIRDLTKTLNLSKGKNRKLSPIITPISSTDKIDYTSADKKGVAVSKKKDIKAKKKGNIKITVKCGKMKVIVEVKVK